MKNITLSANEDLIELARQKAQSQNTTLNAEFRIWLEQYANGSAQRNGKIQDFHDLMTDLADVDSTNCRFSRDELNER